MQNPPEHPVNRPVLQPLMLLLLVLGTVAVLFEVAFAAAVLFACFVVLFGLYWLGWLMREHELWREGRHRQQDRHDES